MGACNRPHHSKDEIDRSSPSLKTLTGELPQIAMLVLLPSSNATPRPDPFKSGKAIRLAECCRGHGRRFVPRY